MLKKEIYPKTKRVSCAGDKVYITEKLDGSNLVFFKKDEELYIAQRKRIFKISELEEVKDILYKGLYQWLLANKNTLSDELYNDSAICGEWLGMGQLKYTIDEFDKKWYMFAKANIDDEFNLGINGPGVALESKTHIAQLSEIRKHDIAERFDIEIKDAPKEGITQGIDDIIKSKIIFNR